MAVYQAHEVIFTTEHLVVYPITPQDQVELLKILQDPDLMKLAWGKTYSLAETRQWLEKIQRQYERTGYSYFFVSEKASDQIVGLIGGLSAEIAGKSEVELAYIIKNFAQGQGYAVEAARGMLHFLHLKGVKSVVAQFIPEHAISKRVVEKIGFHFETSYERLLNGQWLLHSVYRKDFEN